MGRENSPVTEYLARRAATSKELQRQTGLSQPAISKQIKQLGDKVVRIPGGRAPLYALTRNAFGVGDRVPLYLLDMYGNNTMVAEIRPLAHGGYLVECMPNSPAMLKGESGSGYFDDLPYYLQDLRPQGFMGRQIAQELAERSTDFPRDPRDWKTSHIGKYLVANGDDLPGNMIIGEAGVHRLRRKPQSYTRDAYPALAQGVLDGQIAGSSAGGEQPKFTVYNKERNSHVIVKFSPRGDDPIARRWKDILVTEYQATIALHNRNFPAAETELIEREGRLFLESQRFDRAAEYGRSSMISMQSIDSEYIGDGADWPVVMEKLHQLDLIPGDHLMDALVLWEFGHLINNTDMHLGNLSLGMEGNLFRLLPAYDMCSMGFRPVGNEASPYEFKLNTLHSRLNTLKEHPAMEVVIDMATDFWKQVAADSRISTEFKEFLAQGNPVQSISPHSL
ncbi:phosphatidylinositol kinase [Chromatiales bacterium (ex Bugula neritina AB1)]|nr:phosphatidylinositol kinase [Chromatiales bacterium (ex Bugula neritina AB1)]